MNTAAATEALIADLAQGLRPVRRLAPPSVRILAWLAAAVLTGAAILLWVNRPAAHLAAHATAFTGWPPGHAMWLSMAGSILTAIAAAIATFMVSLPDRSPRWAWLPLPPLLLWLGASGIGCLSRDVPWAAPMAMADSAANCMPFIVGISMPLAAVILLLLRRVAPLRPERTALMAGLAVAAASASLIWLEHPVESGPSDLLMHGCASAIVILALRLGGVRYINTNQR